MSFFFLIVLPYFIGGGLIMLGLRLSPIVLAIGLLIVTLTWLYG